ncbi:class E sortase [Streptomyces sp. HPF1205]|uniref:class E sortase n=1 Tax=Streptomyces sp. HPF1205 TaxID=2873262 RepID=UPI001CECDF7B|nr:class E sortase [Streptomyces sp. HPF1205]
MTTLRPERPADGPMSYEDTGQFRAVVESLNDPLNDPLPGRGPAAAEPSPQAGEPRDGREERQAEWPEPVEPAEQRAAPQVPPVTPVTPDLSVPSAPSVTPVAPVPTAPPVTPVSPVTPVTPARQEPTSLWFRAAGAPPASAQPYFPQPEPEPWATAAPASAPAPEAVPGPVPPSVPGPVTSPVPGPVPTPGADLAAGAVGETVQMPVVEVPVVEVPVVEATGVGGPVGETPAGVSLPADGGRAARRKAARQGSGGGGHRARGRAGATAAAPAEAPGAPPAAPLSRVEARKAQRAAKESPAVVLSRVAGELFITLGVLMLLFVVYQLWWTNVRAHAEANGAANHLQKEWNSAGNDPHGGPGTFQPGQGFAIMYIPKLDVKAPIAQGVSKTKVLDKGEIGHYDGALNTAMPWDKTGNFALAAHRNTHGEPFRYINHLVPGDKVVVETANDYYTYVITSSLPSTPPSNTSVLRPIPVGSGFTKPGRYITLTTCTPEFTSKNRLIVWGKLIEERPRSKGKPDALMEG